MPPSAAKRLVAIGYQNSGFGTNRLLNFPQTGVVRNPWPAPSENATLQEVNLAPVDAPDDALLYDPRNPLKTMPHSHDQGGYAAGAERWRVHYNTIRPHSSLGYRSPAPEAWLTNNTGHGEVETAMRFPLPHTPDGGCLKSETAALH